MSEHPTELLAIPLFYICAGECTQNNVVSIMQFYRGEYLSIRMEYEMAEDSSSTK